jgi:DNA-binding transcriptional MerR regulator
VNVNLSYIDGMTEMHNIQWGIKAFAEMFDVTPRTIRFYEDKGLLTPNRANGARIFTPQDGVRFEKIMRGKRLGFTLDDIKEVLDVTDGHVTDHSELLRRRKNFETVISSLQRRRDDVDRLAKDMAEICEVIDSYLEETPAQDQVFDLAQAYQAKFSQTPFIGETLDEFQPAPNLSRV